MLPGETTAGFGALPGKGNEEGVAVLPDEKCEFFHIIQADFHTRLSCCRSYRRSNHSP